LTANFEASTLGPRTPRSRWGLHGVWRSGADLLAVRKAGGGLEARVAAHLLRRSGCRSRHGARDSLPVVVGSGERAAVCGCPMAEPHAFRVPAFRAPPARPSRAGRAGHSGRCRPGSRLGRGRGFRAPVAARPSAPTEMRSNKAPHMTQSGVGRSCRGGVWRRRVCVGRCSAAAGPRS